MISGCPAGLPGVQSGNGPNVPVAPLGTKRRRAAEGRARQEPRGPLTINGATTLSAAICQPRKDQTRLIAAMAIIMGVGCAAVAVPAPAIPARASYLDAPVLPGYSIQPSGFTVEFW